MISFFARESFLGNAYSRYVEGLVVYRLSSEIRGRQMAEYLGGQYNGKRGDVNIFIKPLRLDKVQDGDYVDFGDAKLHELGEELKKRPKIKVIAASLHAYNILKSALPNEIFYIPQQHVNWENYEALKTPTFTAGYIGRPSRTILNINREIKDTLEEVGIPFVACYDWETRQDSIDFYRNIDVLIMGGNGLEHFDRPFQTPTKIINAASFGVPTLAYKEPGYLEFEGFYIPFKGMTQMIEEIHKLSDDFRTKIKAEAAEYHISKIAELYRALK